MASSRRRHPAAGWALLCALPLASAARPRAHPVHALNPTPTPTPLHPVINPIGGFDPSVCSDMALVGNVSAHESRARIAQMGCPPPSLESSADELYSDLATCKRMRMTLPSAIDTLDNSTAIRLALRARGEAYAAADSKSVLQNRLMKSVVVECYVVGEPRKIAQSSALEDLQTAASERALTSTGNRNELLTRLHEFSSNCETMQRVQGDDFTCTRGVITDMLSTRHLSTEGPKEELLARLVEAIGESGDKEPANGQCDVVLEGPVCIAGGKKVIAADASPQGLVAHITFDDSRGLDTSGYGAHAKARPKAFGPGVVSAGHSAKFCGADDYVQVRHHRAFNEAGSSFSMTLWAYLNADATGNWRTLVHKGGTDSDRTPSIFLEPRTRGVEFFVSTTDKSDPSGERIWSNSFLPLHRWTHLAAVADGKSLRLYVNGLLDSENVTKGAILHNTGPIYLGGDPWRAGQGFDGYLDEFKYYTRALGTDEIQAEASSALGGIEPSFVQLGCMGCSLERAGTTCPLAYHLCNQRDLYAGGYMVARTMGWATSSSHVWSAEEAASGGDKKSSWGGTAPGTVDSGLGLCCQDSE